MTPKVTAIVVTRTWENFGKIKAMTDCTLSHFYQKIKFTNSEKIKEIRKAIQAGGGRPQLFERFRNGVDFSFTFQNREETVKYINLTPPDRTRHLGAACLKGQGFFHGAIGLTRAEENFFVSIWPSRHPKNPALFKELFEELDALFLNAEIKEVKCYNDSGGEISIMEILKEMFKLKHDDRYALLQN